MKRIVLCVLALLLSVCMLCACGSDSENGASDSSANASKAESSVDLNNVLADINSQFGISDLKVVKDKNALELYYQISAADVKQFAAEFSKDTSENPQEIILVEAVNEDAAKSIESALKNIQQSRISNAKSYTPELVEVYEKCNVVVDGVNVSLIIDARTDEIRAVYDSYFK